MYQIAFVMLFLYVRTFEYSRYPKNFDRRERESKPDDEIGIDELNRKQQEKLLEQQYQLEARYFLERRQFF